MSLAMIVFYTGVGLVGLAARPGIPTLLTFLGLTMSLVGMTAELSTIPPPAPAASTQCP